MATATVTTSTDEFRFHSTVRGYHVYRSVWDLFLDDNKARESKLPQQVCHSSDAWGLKEKRNCRTYTKRNFKTLLSLHSVWCRIVGSVTGRWRKTTADCGGMEIPSELIFKHTQRKVLDKLEILLKNSKQDSENKQPKNSKQENKHFS